MAGKRRDTGSPRSSVDPDELAGILEGDPIYGGGRIDLATGEVWQAPAVDTRARSAKRMRTNRTILISGCGCTARVRGTATGTWNCSSGRCVIPAAPTGWRSTARELNQHTAQVLARVKAGETFTVTRNGRPLAILRPYGEQDPVTYSFPHRPMGRTIGSLLPAPADFSERADELIAGFGGDE